MVLSEKGATALIAGNIAQALLLNPNTVKMGKNGQIEDHEDFQHTDTDHQEWIAEASVDQAILIMQEINGRIK